MRKFSFICMFLFQPIFALDVLGVGTVCVDHVVSVDEAFIAKAPVEKGGWAPLKWDAFSNVLSEVNGRAVTMTGGCTANTIKGLASLGMECGIISKLGEDEAGSFAKETLCKLGIKPLFAYTTTPTVQVLCLVTPDGERSFCSFVDAEREFSEKDVHSIDARLVYMDGYLLRNNQCLEKSIAMAKKAGCLVAFDLANPRLVAEERERLLKTILPGGVDILFANEAEAKALTGLHPKEAALFLKKLCDVVVVKVGEKGCYVASGDEVLYSPGVPAKVVDTTGAGDLFSAGFLYQYLNKAPLEKCAAFANRTGSAVVEYVGAEIPESRWLALAERK